MPEDVFRRMTGGTTRLDDLLRLVLVPRVLDKPRGDTVEVPAEEPPGLRLILTPETSDYVKMHRGASGATAQERPLRSDRSGGGLEQIT